MYSIEMAEGIELVQVCALCIKSLEEIGPIYYPTDPQEVETLVYLSWESAPCYLLKHEGQIVGFAGLRLTKAPFSKQPILQDYMFYILPEHRNIRNIKALCQAARDFADTTALPLRLEYAITKNQKSQEKLLKLMGFRISGLTGSYNV